MRPTSCALLVGLSLAAGCGSDPAGTAEEACHCTGPGDWVAGDYPPALTEQRYLELKDLPGQAGAVRGYKAHVPRGYDPATPTPVVFAFHGLGQNAVLFGVDGAGWPAKSDAEGFILLMPTGNVRGSDGEWGALGSWNAGQCCGAAAAERLDDVGFVRAVFQDAGKHLNLDRTRVYATGLSNGGFLSYRLACEASDLFVAVAPAAGAIGMPSIGSLGQGNADFTTCQPEKPVSVFASHGDADPLVSYDFYEPSLDHMASENGCSLETTPASVPAGGGDTTCITYQGCPAGVEVTGCAVAGGGHCWFGNDTCGTGAPGIGTAIVGANSDHLDDTEAVWAFLSRLSRP